MDLIEKERNEYEKSSELILKENKKNRIKRIISVLPSTAIGGFIGYSQDSWPLGFVFGALTYQVATTNLSTMNLFDTIKPNRFLENLREGFKLLRGKDTFEDNIDYIQKHIQDIPEDKYFEKKYAEKTLENHYNQNLEGLIELLDESRQFNYSISAIEKLSYKTLAKLRINRIERAGTVDFEKNLDYGVRLYIGGLLDESLDVLRLNIEKGNDEAVLNSCCILGQILENENIEGSEEVFRTAIEKIKRSKKSLVEKGSNEIYLSDSDLANRLFIFKIGKNSEEIIQDYIKTEFIYSFFEDTKNKFVRPIKLLEVDGEVFSITKNVGNFDLKDYLDLKHYEEGKEIIKTSLENLLLLQLKSNKSISDTMNLFDNQNFKKKLDKKYSDTIVEKLNFLFIDSRECWKSIVHGDLHPGNIVLNRKGDPCIIDFEKSKIGLPYMDPITLIDNYSCLNVFEGFEDKKNQLETYCKNAFDSGIVDSFEKSMKYGHILGILENLRLCSLSEKFAGKKLELAKKHHMDCCKSHFEELEDIYEGGKLEKLRDLGNYLFDGR